MSEEQDGGPAFPRPHSEDIYNDEIPYSQRGMSLHDWFVGQAIAGLMANQHPQAMSLTAEEKTLVAFVQANTILKARKK